MIDQPRFTLHLVLRDCRGEQQPLEMAIGLDEEVRISTRAVDDMKAGPELGVSMMTMGDVVTLIRTREIRKSVFRQTAERLGALMAERMEDAEGWHDPSRIEPAREQLGGDWGKR